MRTFTLETDLVPTHPTVEVLDPPAGPTHLLVLLHGGGGGEGFLERLAPVIERAWGEGLPPCLVVAPQASRRFWMDTHDGAERWESLVTGPLLDRVRAEHDLPADPAVTAVAGISMGGMGGLRMALKHPDVFGAVAALEPGIEPARAFDEIELIDRFWRDDALFASVYGDPVDTEFWAANNPASIVAADPDRLRDGPAIYLEAGTEDAFGLDRGTEFLHRVLYDAGLRHEYRYVLGADHVGRSVGPRFADALDFLHRVWVPDDEPDPQVEGVRKMIAGWKAQAGVDESARPTWPPVLT